MISKLSSYGFSMAFICAFFAVAGQSVIRGKTGLTIEIADTPSDSCPRRGCNFSDEMYNLKIRLEQGSKILCGNESLIFLATTEGTQLFLSLIAFEKELFGMTVDIELSMKDSATSKKIQLIISDPSLEYQSVALPEISSVSSLSLKIITPIDFDFRCPPSPHHFLTPSTVDQDLGWEKIAP